MVVRKLFNSLIITKCKGFAENFRTEQKLMANGIRKRIMSRKRTKFFEVLSRTVYCPCSDGM